MACPCVLGWRRRRVWGCDPSRREGVGAKTNTELSEFHSFKPAAGFPAREPDRSRSYRPSLCGAKMVWLIPQVFHCPERIFAARIFGD